MFTQTDYDTLTANAHMITNAKRDSDRDLGISLFLTDAQSGACFDCGRVMPLEFCHIIGSGTRAIATPDGLLATGAMGCRDCNDAHRAIATALGTPGVLPVSYVMTRAHRITASLPTRARLVRLAQDNKRARADHVAARLAECV